MTPKPKKNKTETQHFVLPVEGVYDGKRKSFVISGKYKQQLKHKRLKFAQGDIPCSDCGTEDNAIWFTDNTLWNAVMGEEVGKILCMNCFTIRAEHKYKIQWRLHPFINFKRSV